MRRLFTATVSALCYSLIRERYLAGQVTPKFDGNDAVHFVLRQQARMPDFLRFPFMILTLVFACESIARFGSFFHRQPPERRWLQILSWKNSRLGFRRDFVRFYESLAVLSWVAQHPPQESHVS